MIAPAGSAVETHRRPAPPRHARVRAWGLVALYEPDAVVAFPSTRTSSGATVEIAHRQPDGTWLWTIDQPAVLG